MGIQQCSLWKGYGKQGRSSSGWQVVDPHGGPPWSERQILDWKTGRCPLKAHSNMPRYVHFRCPKSFCGFLIDSNYFKCKSINFSKSQSNKAILSFLSERNMHAVKAKALMSPWIRLHKMNTSGKQPQIKNSTANPKCSLHIPTLLSRADSHPDLKSQIGFACFLI